MNNSLRNILVDLKQDELIKHYEALKEDEKNIFSDDLSKADFKKLALALNQASSTEEDFKIDYQDYYDKNKIYDESIYNKGLEILKAGKAAMLIMSGGMGSRLGFDGPKGAFILADNKSLFEIHIDKLKDIYKKTEFYPYMLIMCSDLNINSTREFFEEHNYFNYPKDRIKFFKQANIPAISDKYKVLLSSKTSIKQVPDGNGGVFDALKKSGILDMLKQEGVKWLNVAGVDNVLLKCLDPFFIAFAENSKLNIASKSVARRDASEKVGVFALKNSKPAVLEYSEIKDEYLNLKREDGEYFLSEANIACHLFNIESKEFEKASVLPFHKAHKKIEYYENDKLIEPEKENAYKYEQFIFDAFKNFDKMAVLRVDREKEFSALKNREGKDSVASAREAYLKGQKYELI